MSTTSAVTQGMKRPSWLTDPTASTFDSTGQLRIFWTLFPKPFCHWFPVVVVCYLLSACFLARVSTLAEAMWKKFLCMNKEQ
jgi:hypothetical protein